MNIDDKQNNKNKKFKNNALSNKNKLEILIKQMDKKTEDIIDLNASADSGFSSFLQESQEVEEHMELIENEQQQETIKQITEENTNIEQSKEPAKKEKIDINNVNLFLKSKNIEFNDNKLSINLEKLDNNDIEFFKQCFAERKDVQIDVTNIQNMQANIIIPQTGEQVSYKSFNISKGLASLIEYAYNSQKPVRLDFGKKSVILNIDKAGKLSAQFMSNDQAVEYAIKSNLHYLRDKFDSEKIPYKELTYKHNSKRQQKGKQGE